MNPLRDLLVIQMEEPEKDQKNSIGLFTPPPKWAKPENVGQVLNKGPLVSSVDVGDYVFINPYAVIDTEVEFIKIVKESDILCQLDKTEE